jgi:hypothetical protein
MRLPMIAVASLALALSTGCGDDGEDRPLSLRETLREAQVAFAAKDVDGLCALLTRHSKQVVGHAAHNTRPVECHKDARNYLRWIKPYPNGGRARVSRVTRTSEDRAVLHVRVPGDGTIAVPAAREGDAWKLDLFEAGLSRIQFRGKPGEERFKPPAVVPPAPTPAEGIRVRDAASRRPCPPVRLDRFPMLTGGCLLEPVKRTLDLSLETAFGVMPFERCGIVYQLRVDRRGRAWVAEFGIDGGSTCFDVMQCWDDQSLKVPWQATVRRRSGGAGYRLAIENVCLDTCLGRFTGRWDLALTKRPRGWRLHAESAVGSTGWRIDGPLESTRRGFVIDG